PTWSHLSSLDLLPSPPSCRTKPPPAQLYTLSLHDALPILARLLTADPSIRETSDMADYAIDAIDDSNIKEVIVLGRRGPAEAALDRKSTRLNSSHVSISYAVFCLKKKTNSNRQQTPQNPTR